MNVFSNVNDIYWRTYNEIWENRVEFEPLKLVALTGGRY
jgi:hypothetical protein